MKLTKILAISFLMGLVGIGYFLEGKKAGKTAFAPHSTEVSPGVYQVVSENDDMRIIVATWKPGQKDDWHSHPAFAAYFLTNVDGKLHYPDGTSRDIKAAAGKSMAMMKDPSHIFENMSDKECQILLVELKRSDYPTAFKEAAPHSTAVSADVYKVITENDDMRVILATWDPGKRDQFHSHPAFAVYFLTDTDARLHHPDGTIKNIKGKAGHSMVMNADASHAFENMSENQVRMVIVEAK